jgi:ketosteroid isomerase-like protein
MTRTDHSFRPEHLAQRLFEAYGDGDLETVRSLLAQDMTAYVTNAAAGVDRVSGRDGFRSRLPNLEGAELSTRITQIVAVDEERAMTMLEAKAKREGRTLHNFRGVPVPRERGPGQGAVDGRSPTGVQRRVLVLTHSTLLSPAG